MKFTKMHGCGNDYVYVNCFEETTDILESVQMALSQLAHLTRQISEWRCTIWTGLRGACAETGSAVWQSLFMTMV